MNKSQKQKLNELTNVKLGDLCPYCKVGTMIKRIGKYGDFIACNQFPHCSFTRVIKEPTDEVIEDKFWSK